jgi:hypothetical protein
MVILPTNTPYITVDFHVEEINWKSPMLFLLSSYLAPTFLPFQLLQHLSYLPRSHKAGLVTFSLICPRERGGGEVDGGTQKGKFFYIWGIK